MGIHIIPKILKHKVSLDSYPPQTYWETKKLDSFDSTRYSGDTDFIFRSNIEWVFQYDDENDKDHEHSYRRPKDLIKARKWIEDNTPMSNEIRLLNLIKDMLHDPTIWLIVSY
jgi:hypothetical protein